MADGEVLEHLIKMAEAGGPGEWNTFRASREAVDLTKADLSHRALADFNFSNCDLSAAKLFNADFSGADLSNANLTYADMRRANFANAYLTDADLSAGNLQGANMVDTNLDGARLNGSRMGGVYLVGSSLVGADLRRADLRGATMKFANLRGARLKGANVEEADLTSAEIDEEAISGLVNYDHAITGVAKDGPARAAKDGKKGKKLPVEENYDELFREEDCYKIMGVHKGASLKEIARAYRQRVKEYHPDRVAHLGEKLQYVANREFQRIQLAYRSLTSHMSDPIINVRVKGADGLSEKPSGGFSIEDYIEMIKWQPNNDVLHYNLGVKYLELGLTELAIRAYNKALEINPENEHATHNLRLAQLMQSLQG